MKSSGENVVQLPDEDIDGVEYWRHRITSTSDLSDGLIQDIEEENDPEMKKQFEELIQSVWGTEITETSDYLVGKDDYLVHQLVMTTSQNAPGGQEFDDFTIPEGVKMTVSTSFRFSDFNSPVEIEAPPVDDASPSP